MVSSLNKNGEPLSNKQLNAVATVNGIQIEGQYVYNPTFGTTLPAGSDTISVTFTSNDSAFLPQTKTVSVQVISATPPASAAKQPLLVLQLLVDPDIGPGKPLQLIMNMLNTTGTTLNVRFLRGISLVPPPAGYAERTKFEDEHWKRFAQGMRTRGSDEQIPSRSEGRSNLRIETPPLTSAQLQEIASGTLMPYFYNIYQDRKTKENLVEVCVYLTPKLGIQDCVNHNKP